MVLTYQLPPGVELDDFTPRELEGLAAHMELHGSLPFVADVSVLRGLSDKALEAMRSALEAMQVAEARRDAAAFVQYAFRHEESGEALTNAPHHVAWHRFLDDHDRAILFAPVEHAKTQQIAVGRVLWTLGTSPSKRLALVSLTQERHADKVVGQVRRHIESNTRVRRVFPDLRPSDDLHDPWGQSRIVVDRDTNAKDPSLQGLGVYGPINGSRLDGIVLDDVLNFENTRTAAQVEKLVEWLDSEVFTRVTKGGWIHWIGTPWTPSDPMHVVAERPGWESARYSAVTNPDDEMEDWRPLWPEQFDTARLRSVYEATTPLNFARKYLCQVRMDSASRFKQSWIDEGLRLGRGMAMDTRRPMGVSGQPMQCFTGVDLGVGRKSHNDLSVAFTIGVDADTGHKRVLDIRSGRWTAPEIVQHIHDVVYRFGSIVYVEDNAAQDFLLQWASGQGLPVRGYTTTAGRKFDEHFGVESLAVELRNGQWSIPSGTDGKLHPEIEAWIREMLYYSPDTHTGDRLMASWFAREAARNAMAPMVQRMDTLAR